MWTLTKAISIREDEDAPRRLRTETWEFAGFAEARNAFRELLRACAMKDERVFAGDGRIRNLGGHFARIRRWLNEHDSTDESRRFYGLIREAPDYGFMAGDFKLAESVPETMREWILAPEAYSRNPLPSFRWTDWGLGVVSTP